MRTIDAVVSMFRTIFVAVPALRRVEPAITSGPTAGAIVRSTKVCSSVRGSQVTKMIFEPARRARVSAPRTNCVIPLAETPMTTSFFVGRSRLIERAPSSWLSSTPSLARRIALLPPAMMARTRSGLVPKVGGISADSRTPRRPLVPAPTKMMRPPFRRTCVMISTPTAIRSFSRCTAASILRSSFSIPSTISAGPSLSMASVWGLMASVGSDCHLDRTGMARTTSNASRGYYHSPQARSPITRRQRVVKAENADRRL